MCVELMYLFLGFYVIGILGLQTFSKFSTIPEQIKKAPLDPVSKRCPKEEEDQEEPVAVRFPYYPPLLDVVEAQLASGLPVEWWLGRDGLNDEAEDEEAEAMKIALTLSLIHI